jgi:hypothetical protein
MSYDRDFTITDLREETVAARFNNINENKYQYNCEKPRDKPTHLDYLPFKVQKFKETNQSN